MELMQSIETTSKDELFKHYESVKVVGQGSFGTAVLYKNLQSGVLVVLKQIEVSNLNKEEMQMALNEVKVFSKLKHPNIISYMRSFMCGTVLVIEMEYADGGTLAQIIADRSDGPRYMSETSIVFIFKQITSSVCYMHSENILHRDLKTANVFINKQGDVKIGDFGISKMMNTRLHTQTLLGTPYYFSPEMCQGHDYNSKSDIWALGCILVEMCCLQKSFAATNLSDLVAKIIVAQYTPIPERYSKLLKDLVDHLLQVESINRPAASDVLQNWLPLLCHSLESKQRFVDFKADKIQDILLESKRDLKLNVLPATRDRSVVYEMQKVNHQETVRPLGLPSGIRIGAILSSSSHTLVLSLDGHVYAWSDTEPSSMESTKNSFGLPNIPTRIEELRSHIIVSACAGNNFSIFVSDSGAVYGYGENNHGCLGGEVASNCEVPQLLANLKGIQITQVSCGSNHVVAVDSDQNLYSWGTSKVGALGSGYLHRSTLSAMITNSFGQQSNEIAKVVCGPDSTCVILANGELYACGSNAFNRLGFGKDINMAMSLIPVLEFQKNVIDVSSSDHLTCVLLKGGLVYTMGRNHEGQRGLGHCKIVSYATKVCSLQHVFIKKVCCLDTYCVAISDSNVSYMWGLRSIKSDVDDSEDVAENELMLQPTEMLCLYSSQPMSQRGFHLQFSDLVLQKQKILLVVNTTAPPF